MKSGDVIIAIDGQSLESIDFNECVRQFRDVKNKPIELIYKSEGDTLQTTLRRVEVVLSPVSSLNASVDSLSGLNFASFIEIGCSEYYAVYLKNNSSEEKKKNFELKQNANGLRLIQIQNNVISYELKSNGEKNLRT